MTTARPNRRRTCRPVSWSIRSLIACAITLGSASAARAAEPTEADVAPIAIPTGLAPSSDFARRLGKTCTALGGNSAPLATARAFRLAPLDAVDVAAVRRTPGSLPPSARDALAGLRATCDRIADGDRLDAGDLDNLRAFRQNPALAQARVAQMLQLLGAATATQQTSPPATLTSSGSLEADVIAGLATFIYDRAKQEAVLYLGRKLGERLCTDRNRLFFPSLCLAIGESDPPLSLAAMGSYLAVAARRDLENLPDRVLAYQWHQLPPGAPAIARESVTGARLGLAYFRAVMAGRTPLDTARALHRLPASTPGSATTVFVATARASDLVDAVAAQEGWSGVASATDGVARQYALGVLFTLGDLLREDGLTAPPIDPDQVAALVPLIARYLTEAGALAERTQRALASLRKPSATPGSGRGDFKPGDGGGGGAGGSADGDDQAALDYAAAAGDTLQSALQTGVAVAQRLGLLNAEGAATATRVAEVIALGEQMVAGKSPSEVVIAALDLLRQLSQRLTGPEGALAVRVVTDVKAVVVLMSQVAQAESADEVAQVLEAAAAPIATYETKYRQPVVALGALVGASTGFEALRTNTAGWSTGWIAGAFAPVGITASTPLAGKWHAGAMLSVINLGGLVSTRFSEDTRHSASGAMETVKADPAVKVANVFAPGLWLTLGLYGSPLSFSLGGQVVPQGRQVVNMAGTESTTAALQLLGTLALDVPILTF